MVNFGKKKEEPKQEEVVQPAPDTTVAAPPADTELANVQMSKEDLKDMYGDMDRDDITVPRLVILQGLSPEVTQGLGRPGEFYVKGLEQNVGKGPVEFIVLMRNKSRIRWQDLKFGGGILCRSIDAKQGVGDPGGPCEQCPHSVWNGQDKPACDVYQNLIVVLKNEKEWMPMAISGNRTKLKAIKNLNSMLMVELAKSRPLFAKSYTIEAITRTNNQGMQYWSYRIGTANDNAVLPLDLQQRALAVYTSLKGKTIEIVQENEAEPATEEQTHKDF